MKRKTRVIALCAVLLCAVGITVAVSLMEKEREDIAESGEVVFSLPVDEVDALAWTYTDGEGEEQSFSFTKGDGWTWDEDADFPADGEMLDSLLERFASLQAAFVIENVTDYAQYGLDEPQCTIDITAGETAYEISLGNFSELDGQRYLSLGDGSVYLVNDDPLDYYGITLDDLLRDDEIPALTDVTELRFSGHSDATVKRDGQGGSYREEDVYYLDGRPLDTGSVEGYVSGIASLALDAYVTYAATEEDLARCGLDEPELTVSIDYPEPDTEQTATFELSVSRAAEDRQTSWEEVLSAMESEQQDGTAQDAAERTAYLRIGQSGILYQISYDTLAKIMACAYDDLRHDEIFPAEFADVSELAIALDGETYAFTTALPEGEDAAAQTDGETVWYLDGEAVDMADVDAALSGLTASRFADDAASGAEEIRLTATLALADSPRVELVLYRADGESCLALVDGAAVGYVPRSQAVDLIEAIRAIVLG